jgi:hypothetical protein
VDNDLPGLADLMGDESEWASVPSDRFARRRDLDLFGRRKEE